MRGGIQHDCVDLFPRSPYPKQAREIGTPTPRQKNGYNPPFKYTLYAILSATEDSERHPRYPRTGEALKRTGAQQIELKNDKPENPPFSEQYQKYSTKNRYRQQKRTEHLLIAYNDYGTYYHIKHTTHLGTAWT